MLVAAQHPSHLSGGAITSAAAGDGREATEEFLAQQECVDGGNDDSGSTPAPSSSAQENNALTATVVSTPENNADDVEGRPGDAVEEGVAPDEISASMDRDEGRVSTPPPPEEEGGCPGGDGDLALGETAAVTPSRPVLSPLHFASPPRTAGGTAIEEGDLQGRVRELEQTVATLLEIVQAQQQALLAPRTPVRVSLRPTASQLCLHPLDSPSPTPRSSKAIAREQLGQQGALSVPDLDEGNVDAAGNSLRRLPIPDPTPDLEYRTYTAEYEEELKKIRADRQRGMSFDVAEMVERNIRDEAEAEAGRDPGSSSGSSKASSQSSLDNAFPERGQGEGKTELISGEKNTESSGGAGGGGESGTNKVDPGKRSVLPPRVPRRNRSTGELKKLNEQPTSPIHSKKVGDNGSPKGVEDGPSGDNISNEAGQASIPSPPVIETITKTKKGSKRAKVEKSLPGSEKPTATTPTIAPEASTIVESQNLPQLAMKRTPMETAAVISATDQDKEPAKTGQDVPKKERSRRRGSERNNDTTASPEASKSTPKTSKKSTPQPQKKNVEPLPQKAAPPVGSMFAYIKNDLLSNMNLDSRQQDGSASEDVDANMQEFIRVPSKLESLLFFGLAICTDSFLYVLAFLPLKCLWSCICLFCTILRPGKGIRGCRFHRRHLYQILLTLVIWAVYRHVLVPISIGKMYHWIRGQAMIKLYVMIAIVEVFDRLMCSLGQDSLDSLYWNTTRRPYHPRMVISTFVVLIYATLHSLILFVHIGTLNVAMNSSDQALLTLLISGNFAEIKSTVFKKYNKQNLFKITTSDICERFKLMLFLGLILLLNCFQGGMNRRMIEDYIMVSGVVMFAEMICDWIKHSFITKFNFIKSAAYPDYALILAGDVTGVGHEGINLNHTHAVVKRLGFSQIPLVCVFARYIREALRYGVVMSGENGTGSHHFFERFAALYTDRNWSAIAAIVLGVFHCLLLMKIVLGYSVLKACRRLLDGPTPKKSDDSSRPTEKLKGMTAGESAKQDKPAAPRRQAV